MPEQPPPERHLAMLIDADNAQLSLVKQMIEEVSRYGKVTIRRAYGDFTQPNLANWRSEMLTYAIQPIQQWRYTTGKNATDSALIIDAMDVLHTGTVQGFCIVSSDSDYTRLCTRIREKGLFVMGMGRKLTPDAFVNACDVFVHVENLDQTPPPAQTTKPTSSKKPTSPKKTAKTAQPKKTAKTAQPNKVENEKAAQNSADLMNLLQRAFDISAQGDGWVLLSALGDALRRLEPSFDSRTYGHKTLSGLVQSLPDQLVVKGATKTGPSKIYVRLKDE